MTIFASHAQYYISTKSWLPRLYIFYKLKRLNGLKSNNKAPPTPTQNLLCHSEVQNQGQSPIVWLLAMCLCSGETL